MTGLRRVEPEESSASAGSEHALRRDLARRLIAGQFAAVLGNFVMIVVVSALLWPAASHRTLLVLAAAVVTSNVLRLVAWRRGQGAEAPEAIVPAIRLSAAAVGLAWGIGIAILAPELSSNYLALLLLVASGGVAAGAGTLAADLPAFRLLALTLLAPLPIGILAAGHDRFHLAAFFLVIFFAAFSLRLHWYNYKTLVELIRASARLEADHQSGLRERAFLEAILVSVPNAIAVVDGAGRFLSTNPGFEALFGYQQEELPGRLLVDLIVPEAGREAAELLQDRVRKGETVVTETERRRKDGALVTVRVSVAQVEGQGRILFLYTDMTATRRAEEASTAAQARLEQVFTSSTAVIYATRIDGTEFTPSWVSDNLKRITGFEIEEALDPAWWYHHLHPDDRARVLAELPRLLSDDQLTMEYRFQQKDGHYRWMRDESRLIRDPSGAPQEIFGAWLDITDLKLAEDTMREARDLAVRSARTRAEFLANMSHEIRTPMNAVLGLTELVLDSDLAPEQRRSLRLVQTAGETLLSLLNDVLDLSKIEGEHLTLEAIPFDLRYLLESTVSLLSVRAADKPIELAADVGADLPHLVSGDPTRLRQVLSNLVSNAIKFTARGEIVLAARCEPQPDGQSRIRFAVRDTGIGIPADKLGSIFQEFTQADASMTRRYGGTGLGLTIARRLVTLMSGELTVTSEEGRGSNFTFSLPLPIAQERPQPAPGLAMLAGQRMLVVDDNATNCRIVREMLGAANVSVDEAGGTAEGIAALTRAAEEGRPYGLAIIDAQMPDRDGFDLAAAVRSDPRLAATRLLMLTSAGQRGDTQRCREVGIEGYLMKPLARSDLLEATAALLGPAGQTARTDLVTRHSIAESRRRLSILLAEDNPVNQLVAATMLRNRGHSVTVANNGREAVDAVARGNYDLVLMDIQMPELDGFAATEKIRASSARSDLPIIALTAHALSGERERCLARGMTGYLAKPFRPHELFAAVEGFGPMAPVAAPEGSPDASGPVDLIEFRSAMREAGAEGAVERILDLFMENAPERLAEVTGAMAAADGPAIERAAHAFKSPAGSIGAKGLAGLLAELELAGKAGAIDRARIAFNRVGPETESVLRYLRLERGKEEIHD